MIIEFVTRNRFKTLIKNDFFKHNRCATISISDTHSERDSIRDLWDNHDTSASVIRRYRFKDIEGIESQFDKVADDLATYLKLIKQSDYDIVIIHCFAGISRSGAVAKALNDYIGHSVKFEQDYLRDYQGHNKYVYYTLLEALEVPTLRSYYKELEEKHLQ